jgi:TetR/AcrR family transcriptional regulator
MLPPAQYYNIRRLNASSRGCPGPLDTPEQRKDIGMNTQALGPAASKAGAKKKTRITLRNEEKIVDAAQGVIAEFGFHGATIDLIAERAGISKPNLHYYFPTKVDVQIAALKRTLDVWVDSLAKLDPLGDPAEQLSRYIAEKVEMAHQNPVASRVFANEILRGAPLLNEYLRTELRGLVKQKAKVIQGWIDQGKLAPIEPVCLVFLIWAATQHYADFAPQVHAVLGVKSLTPGFFQEVQTFLCNIVLRGVLPRAQDPPYPAADGTGKTSAGPKAAGRRLLRSNRRTPPKPSRKRI